MPNMTAAWHFQEHQRHGKVRNPIQGEFFSDEAVANPAQALVREAIQNSMDARSRDHRGPVRVRFFISGDQAALSAAKARRWFHEAWGHFRARGSGLRSVPEHAGACRFVTIEDFGTTGLTGDARQGRVGDGTNRFFNFWRAEGVSEKGGRHGGRWGVGKTVFPRSSQVSTFFGLTVREREVAPLLMGQSILRHHQVGDKEFTPDGFFGEMEPDGFVLPVVDPTCMGEFRRDFAVSRDRDLGLSVVIVYADLSLTWSATAIAVVRDYFFPILTQQLVVDVEAPDDDPVRLDHTTLMRVVHEQGDTFAELQQTLELTSWVVDKEPVHVALSEHGAQSPPAWAEDSIPASVRASLRTEYLAGRRIAMRVPVVVRPTDGPQATSYFDVYLQRDPLGKGSKPLYVRNGIIIPDVRERRVYGHRLHALVVCEDESLGRLLGDAETPAHTHWSKDAHNFRGKYEDGAAYLTFVAHAPRSIAELLSATPEGRDRFSLASLFPRPEGESTAPDVRRRPGPPTPPDRPPKDTKPRFVVDAVKGGVSISAGAGMAEMPARVRADFAYDVRRGNALSRYHPADFRLEDMSVKLRDAQFLQREGNVLVIVPSAATFRIDVTGFDSNRDVYVRVREIKGDG